MTNEEKALNELEYESTSCAFNEEARGILLAVYCQAKSHGVMSGIMLIDDVQDILGKQEQLCYKCFHSQTLTPFAQNVLEQRLTCIQNTRSFLKVAKRDVYDILNG